MAKDVRPSLLSHIQGVALQERLGGAMDGQSLVRIELDTIGIPIAIDLKDARFLRDVLNHLEILNLPGKE